MSQYTEFYVANAGSNEFVEIGCYGRSSKIAEIFSPYARWEKIRQITRKTIAEVRENCRNELEGLKKEFEKHEMKKHLIAEMNNSIDEKLDWINWEEEVNADIITEIEDLNFAKNFVGFLSDIIESGVEVYCGIECGIKVSREDIER